MNLSTNENCCDLPVAHTGDIDDPGGLGCLHLIQQQVGEKEVTEMVDLEDHLLSVLGYHSLRGKGSRVVDEDVHLLFLLVHLLAELPDRGEGGQVAFHYFDI